MQTAFDCPINTVELKSTSLISDSLMRSQVRPATTCLWYLVSRTISWIWRSNCAKKLNSECQAVFWRCGYIYSNIVGVGTDVITNDVTNQAKKVIAFSSLSILSAVFIGYEFYRNQPNLNMLTLSAEISTTSAGYFTFVYMKISLPPKRIWRIFEKSPN